MLHGVFQHTVAHDPAILNGETGGKRDLRQAKESRSRGAGLRGVAVNGVLAEQQQVIVAYLLRRLCKRVRGRKSVSAAERAVRQQVRLIAAECERLFQHVLSLGRTHGDRSDSTAKFFLQLQCALYGICVKGVEDALYTLALEVTGNLLYKYEYFHIKSPKYRTVLLAENRAADDHAQYLAGAFADLKELGVSHEALNVEFLAVAVAAENLKRLKADLGAA